MIQAFKKLLGIPQSRTDASDTPIAPAIVPVPKVLRYLPESLVPEGGIDGVAEDGSTWQEWRVDPVTGEQWYACTSRVDAANEILGIDGSDELPSFEPPYEIDADGEKVYDAAVALRNVRARLAAKQLAKRGEILCEGGSDE